MLGELITPPSFEGWFKNNSIKKDDNPNFFGEIMGFTTAYPQEIHDFKKMINDVFKILCPDMETTEWNFVCYKMFGHGTRFIHPVPPQKDYKYTIHPKEFFNDSDFDELKVSATTFGLLTMLIASHVYHEKQMPHHEKVWEHAIKLKNFFIRFIMTSVYAPNEFYKKELEYYQDTLTELTDFIPQTA